VSAAPRGRLAPSPTGALHLGNARTFLLAWLSLRARGGSVVLRIEDLDHPKNKPGAVQGIFDDLRWLGFDWDEGPDCGGAYAPYIQTQRRPRYAVATAELAVRGLIYPCVCSRRDVAAAQSAPHAGEMLCYDGTCRDRFPDYAAAFAALPPDRLPAWRFRVDPSTAVEVNDLICGRRVFAVGRDPGDFVLARDPDGAGYALAVVVDDAAMGITEVVRGDDLLDATPCQLLVYRALGLTPPAFAHVPLVVGADGRRLAKRHGDTRLAAFRDAGVPSAVIIGWLAATCGLAHPGEQLDLRTLIARFDWSLLPRCRIVWTGRFDEVARANQ